MSDSFTCPECHQSWSYFDVRKKRDPRLTSFRTICEGCCERIKSEASPSAQNFHVERNHKTGGTSAQAAQAAAKKAVLNDTHRTIWKAIAERPMTADEVAEVTGINLLTARPRMSDLVSAGWAEATGERRAPYEGAAERNVYRAVTKSEQGRAA
ncbi:winged helix-turn-helix domain-containing protein [Henriciella aquimarina]|uniref:winged helix-turn-helix domain-containing protein n=1 Tax=Henriciella aquimarina TaxID=545261 RepID=UPI000A056BA5|nr:winged helix-turn-helix domain-containing protein [Henriciella aquimarina]